MSCVLIILGGFLFSPRTFLLLPRYIYRTYQLVNNPYVLHSLPFYSFRLADIYLIHKAVQNFGREFGYFGIAFDQRYRRILRALFNEAVRYKWITNNPVCATKVGAEKGNTSLRPVAEKEVFTVKEARAFLRKLDEDIPDDEMHKKVILKFILLTGVRNGEMCGLKWSDIDFDKKVVHIRRNRLYSKQFGYYEKTPKTKTSVRDIPLTAALIDDLKKYMDWFRLADEDFDSFLDETYLAVNVYRQPLYPQSIGQWPTFYERKWDMKHVTCHGLRHTYCSLLLEQNVPIQTVSKYMGHSESTVTLKVYSHFIPDTQGIAVNALNRLTE